MTASIIEIKNLSFSYSKNHPILKNINLNVSQGSIYGFLGPNGAGKSTTMQLLTHILQDHEGEIKVFGKPLEDQTPHIFTKIGALVESPALYLHLTGYENLKCITTLKRIEEKRIPEVLKLVGLESKGDLKAKKYSLGMKQRLAIAMTLLGDPELLLLDEPVNGLDPSGITEVRELLVKLNKELGLTIFISSHLLSEIEKMCTHVGIIHHGELKFEGTMEALAQRSSKHHLTVQTSNAALQLERVKEHYKNAKLISKNEFQVTLNSKEETPQFAQFAIEKDIPLYQMKAEDGLENWFLSLTK
ncbi:ABC transporter ATP-binding protein [uncultured Nonlabens sp.]|uniref:ABC transporter ATP-binding protein n=1 Tax=uncultured Nonlabens sp. TaxID=859306 RepID=UPI0030DCA52D|tara:strand:- start:26513 stop:27418 length:906 start_codon:yes stop_codon:yes gene_type:complete